MLEGLELLGDFIFLILRALGPLDGRSEYLVQKTQAGHSCPLGPLTIPGGTSSSFLPSLVSSLLLLLFEDPVALPELEEDVLDDKSTGWFTMLLLFTFEVVEGGDEEGSFFTPMRLVFD